MSKSIEAFNVFKECLIWGYKGSSIMTYFKKVKEYKIIKQDLERLAKIDSIDLELVQREIRDLDYQDKYGVGKSLRALRIVTQNLINTIKELKE